MNHQRFDQFVTTPPLGGLGVSMRLIEKLVDAIDQPEERVTAIDLLGKAVQPGKGGDRRSGTFRADNIRSENVGIQGAASNGTSREAGLRRLRSARPDLHTEVLAGRLTTHAAMVQAGFRRKSVTIPVDNPENTARALRRNLEPEVVAELARLLAAES